jgi:hypothetical protein
MLWSAEVSCSWLFSLALVVWDGARVASVPVGQGPHRCLTGLLLGNGGLWDQGTGVLRLDSKSCPLHSHTFE